MFILLSEEIPHHPCFHLLFPLRLVLVLFPQILLIKTFDVFSVLSVLVGPFVFRQDRFGILFALFGSQLRMFETGCIAEILIVLDLFMSFDISG